MDKMVSLLADAECTLINLTGPPCLPSDLHKFRRHLQRLFSSDSTLRSHFLSGYYSYIQNPGHLHRVLIPCYQNGLGSTKRESLTRILLLVPSIQLELQNMLLEKLPEYFDVDPVDCHSSSLDEDVARLIINHFRWLDFLVDSKVFTDKLLQVLSICPLHLKKEIIGSLPDIIGDQNNKAVVDSLEQMLQEDSSVIVPVLDSFSNLKLDDQLQEQVITIALSCIRTIDSEHLPNLLRFLLLSATPLNVRRIIYQIRTQLKFIGLSNSRAMQHKKLKGKALVDSSEASILDALKSSLRFKNTLCQEILKELRCLDKAWDHKVIDIWLLMLIYMSSEQLRKSVEKILRKKIVEGLIQEGLFDQCIRGNKELVQDYFPSFVSLSEHLLACKEQKARNFGMHIYTALFEEFSDTCSRQEVLGALVTHVGSGISFEVNSALETMVFLASKYSQELVRFSYHINGILDYLEAFSNENLHKVYEVFSHLALSARSGIDPCGSFIANELLMIVRKQVSNPDLKYKKMGLIGTLKIVSCFGSADITICPSASEKSNIEEALELLKASTDSCKLLPLPLILFYDELITTLENKVLHPAIMEWIGKHVGEFESMFLADLEGGNLPCIDSYGGLEGELWMNLDGDISPICLNVLPLASSSFQSPSSLQVLPVNFLLLSVIERLANQGSLGGIDALLGCPLHLPSSKYFTERAWQSLSGKQKKIVCLSLFYAANWTRELLNVFCTQVAGNPEYTSQATREELIGKLSKRLRNLVFLECLLDHFLKSYSLSLPELQLHTEYLVHAEKKNEHKRLHASSTSKNNKKDKKISKDSVNGSSQKHKQPTIIDVLKKAGSVTSEEVPDKDTPKQSTSETAECQNSDPQPANVDVSAVYKVLEAQRHKFRPLRIYSFSILEFTKNQDSCCTDPSAELPLYLYLVRDLHYKLDCFSPPNKLLSSKCLSCPPGLSKMTVYEFLRKIDSLFPVLKKHFSSAISIIDEGTETCEEHWKVQSDLAGNPYIPGFFVPKSSVSCSFCKEILSCIGKMLSLPDIHMNLSVLSNLLEAFQPVKISDSIFSNAQEIPSPGNLEYLYCGSYSFLEEVLDIAICSSFVLASEVLFTLESIVNSVHKYLDTVVEGNGKNIHTGRGFVRAVLPTLRNRLGNSALNILRHDWDDNNLVNDWKGKGDIVQKVLRIFLEYSESTSDLLDELACSILPQVPLSNTTADDGFRSFQTLRSATFLVWYRVLHEENLTILNKLVKEIVLLEKSKEGVQPENVKSILIKVQQSVNVVVSLVNMCRTHDKVAVHAMTVKFGGKFVDLFLKVFDFLQTHFKMHNGLIIRLVKELQKATRTIQTLCSEAKGLKQTSITSKIPATKRSMERFLFQVKALLHTASSGCTFWMGNLKHKDLMGQVVSSQAYDDDRNDPTDEHHMEAGVENQSVASEEEVTEKN